MLAQKKIITRCFDLAQLGKGSTSPNPAVGAVIVAPDGRIIGEGHTSPYGGPHAEVNAVASVAPADRSLLESATIYVTLEPCFHFGKTPPCVDLILEKKIPHVVILYTDPNPKVAGQSIKKLRQNGVGVELYFYNNTENFSFSKIGREETLSPFFTNILTHRPYIILKWAQTIDGYIGQSDKRIGISNDFTRRLVHKWRSEVDAIMVGTNTVALDNPELTTRLYFGKSPVRVVLDKNLRLSHNLHVFDESVKTLVYTEGVNNTFANKSGQIQIQQVTFDNQLLHNITNHLYDQKIGILLVEGGAQLLQSFIEKNLWDEARVFQSVTNPVIKNGVHAPQIPIAYLEKKMQIVDNQLFIFKKNNICG